MMGTRDFHYQLPPDLIAQHPLKQRSASRLLHLDGAAGDRLDCFFMHLTGLLVARDLLVFNDTRVIPARLRGAKSTGGKVEVLVERILDEHRALAHVKASKAPREGCRLHLDGGIDVTVTGRRDDLFDLHFASDESVWSLLDAHGHMPLPPYIARPDHSQDRDRYQTVYARHAGAVAAPTAGLHFDAVVLSALEKRGVEHIALTLHIGAGTFQPVRVRDFNQHRMHAEHAEVSPAVCAAVERCRSRGGRVVAVGTTVVRALETAARGGKLQPFRGDTDIFITPGFEFSVVDALITNFHLPESTLLMLVCAFGGYTRVMAAYRHAIEKRYRFYSYGDAMFVTRQPAEGSHASMAP